MATARTLRRYKLLASSLAALALLSIIFRVSRGSHPATSPLLLSDALVPRRAIRSHDRFVRAVASADFGKKKTTDVYRPTFAVGPLSNPRSSCSSVQVVGMFNTGTNYFRTLLAANIDERHAGSPGGASGAPLVFETLLDEFDGLWQHRVPWNQSSFEPDEDAEAARCNVVMVRNPFAWMNGIHKASYELNCIDAETMTNCEIRGEHFDDVIEVWNKYYQWYLQLPVPFTVVRYEDTLEHPVSVLDHVERALGIPMKQTVVTRVASPAKVHGQPRGFESAYNNAMFKTYLSAFPAESIEYISNRLDSELMRIFHYTIAER